MRRRHVLPTVVLAACMAPAGALATSSEPPPTSEAAAPSDDFVLQISYEGGFIPQEVAFVRTPSLVVTADGRLVRQGAVAEIYPGPLVPTLVQQTITEEGVAAFLELAEEHRLLEHRDYADNDMIADAPFTVVTIRVGNDEFVHSAYALGIDDEDDPDRAELYDFVVDAMDTGTVVGDDALGDEVPFESESYLIQAYEVDRPEAVDDEIEPMIVDWPADAGVDLAAADVCAEIPVEMVGDLFADATQLTYFAEDGDIYRVAAIQRLPGRSC